MEDNKTQEVENTEVLSEGGDMKVSETETQEKPSKPSAIQEDGSYKVDLKQSSTNKTENDALRKEKQTDKKSNEEEKQVEKEEKVDSPVLEEVTETVSKQPVVEEQEVEEKPVVENTKEKTPEMELPENVEKLVKFMNETGGTIDDYVKLNTDYSKLDDKDLLKSYYQQTKSHLTGEEIEFLIDDNFNFDEELDEPRDIKRKKLAYKEAVAEAKTALETNKKNYYEDIKLGSKLLPEQQKAIDFFNRYNKEQGQANELQQKAKTHFDKETDKVFNENFKGFDFQVGDKKYRFNVKDVARTKEFQSNVYNIIDPYLKDNMLHKAGDYHKTLFAASNADAIANHFYEQGRADAIKNITSEAKNIKMDRKTDTGTDAKPSNVRLVSGDDSSKLKFKLKNY
jgi:hypothetical protein